MNRNQGKPPADGQIELSLFGPGVGECVVVHLGDNEWMIVDSCFASDGTTPIALDYLRSIGVNPDSQVKVVIATHWHDDHIAGMRSVLLESSSATFYCSSAFDHHDFFEMLAAGESIKNVSHRSGVDEFRDVLEVIRDRGNRAPSPEWAISGRVLHNSEMTRVTALSPSSQTVADGFGIVATQVPKYSGRIRPFRGVSPNDSSVVLHVESRDIALLLGGDLEAIDGDQKRGWWGAINSSVRPQAKANAFKVAHHGSKNGDIDEIWTELLHPSPYSLLTPYARGRKKLPSDEDVRRLLSRTDKLFATVSPNWKKPTRRRGVDHMIGRVAKNRRAIRKQPGQIRIRCSLSGAETKITIERFDGAVRLK